MSVLIDAAQGKEPDNKRDLEELYEKLFPKIGRDFVYQEDLYRIIDAVKRLIDPLGLIPLDMMMDVEARKRALQYKITIESGVDGTKLYNDLINLDD